MADPTFECCAWGDGQIFADEDGQPVYPDRCNCSCHTPEEDE